MKQVYIIKFAKKIDYVIIAVILAVALIVSLLWWLKPFEGELYASIYIDGEYVESIPLEEDMSETEIKTLYGVNVLVILDNKAYINESDCGLKQCVQKGAVSRPGQSIVCAPHGLVVTIEDESTVEGK